MPSQLRRILGLGTPRGSRFGVGLLLLVLEGLSAIALLAVSAWLISAAAEQPPIMWLNEAIVGVRGFALGRAFFRYTQRLALHDSAFSLLSRTRPKLFAKIGPLAPAGLPRVTPAEFADRLVNDVDELQNLSLRVMAPVVQSAAVSLLTVAALALMAPVAGAWFWLLVILLLASMVALPITSRQTRLNASLESRGRASVNTEVSNLIGNLDVLTAFQQTEQTIETIKERESQQLRAAERGALGAGIGTGILSFLFTLAVVISARAGSVQVLIGGLDHRLLAVLTLVPLAVYDLLLPLMNATGSWQKYVESATRLLRLEDIQTPVEITWGADAIEVDSVQSLEISKATFRYPGAHFASTPDVSLALRPGDSLLITGPSGMGKTTIAYGLAGLLFPVAGEALLNGKPLNLYRESDVRHLIGYLEQTPTIFEGTLRVNLLIAKPDATDEELWQVLEQTRLAETFAQRQGLDTQLGQRGAAISGGEAQRIALARALLAKFQVLIFDEPTSNIDYETAELLWQDLSRLQQDDASLITVFITHQPGEALKTNKHLALA